MTIETNHRGFAIFFREDDDSWSCHGLGLKNASLKSLKRSIDQRTAQGRKLSVPALYLTDRDDEPRRVVVTILCEPEQHYSERRRGYVAEVCHAWIENLEKGKPFSRTLGGGRRIKADIDCLFPLETAEDMRRLFALRKIAADASAAAERFEESLTPYNADTLALAEKERRAAEGDKPKRGRGKNG